MAAPGAVLTPGPTLGPVAGWLRRWELLSLVFLSLATILTYLLVARIFPAPGLEARYFSDTAAITVPLRSETAEMPSTDTLRLRQQELGRETFRTEWRGYLAVEEEGLFRFGLESDDGAYLYLDGELVVDNGGVHGAQLASGQVHVEPGSHHVYLQYHQAGGDLALRWLWSREDAPLADVPADALSPTRTSLVTIQRRRVILRLRAPLAALWALAVVWFMVRISWALWSLVLTRYPLAHTPIARTLAPVLLLAFGLGVWGMEWGLPERWAMDELQVAEVIDATQQRFSAGWHHAYPPVQFYIIGAVLAPFELANRIGVISLDTDIWSARLLIMRMVTLLMGLGTLVGIYCCGALAFSRQAGVWASLLLVLSLPFAFYTKTANTDVPHLFWLTWSMYLYLRLWFRGTTMEYALLGVTATLAVCTKDTAYGFYALLPLVLYGRVAVDQQTSALGSRLRQALLDRRLWVAGLSAVVVFGLAHNFLFNWRGAIDHFTATASLATGYRMFDSTPVGAAGLMTLTIRLLRWSHGWPLFALCAAGLATALATRPTRALTLWLFAPAASYFLTFLFYVGFAYDRFLLGISIPFVLVGGRLAAALLAMPGGMRPLRQTIVACAFAFGLLNVVSLNYMMSLDARYAAEDWLRGHVSQDEQVGWFGGMREYMPRMRDLPMLPMDVPTDGVLVVRPEYLLVNTETLSRTSAGQLLRGNLMSERLGYREVWRLRSPLPWWAVLRFEPAISNGLDDADTNLDNINPDMAIFERLGPL